MRLHFLFFILFYTASLSYPLPENILDQDLILNNINVLTQSSMPGSAFAIKLSKNTYDIVRVCNHADCIKLTNHWQLMSTLVDGPTIQQILVESKNGGWFLTSLHLEKDLFQLKSPAKLRLPTSVRARIENKDELVNEERKYNLLILKTISKKDFPCEWQSPLPRLDVVSEFGSTRTLPTGEVYSHKGLDLHAPMKTHVHVVADGNVLSTDPQIVSGNTINVDHGQGLISRYFHLSEFKVQKGDEVKKDQVIALSGATGRVEAPHLHWEMRVRGTAVEPRSTLKLMSQLCGPE